MLPSSRAVRAQWKEQDMKPLILVLLAAATLTFFPACDDSGNGGNDSDADTDTDTDADTDADPVDTYDFAAAAPWYTCPEEDFAEGTTIVTAFDQTYQYFAGEEDFRTVETTVDFPETSGWAQVGMMFHLECPEGGYCDHWDRAGSVQMVLNPEDDPADWEQLEIFRHVTPYRMEMCQYIDVTEMASLFVGQQTLTSFIDTWVGPESDQGNGWRVTVKFVFYPGDDALADRVVNVWGRRNITVGEIEDDVNVDSQIDPFTLSVPAGATRVEAHLTTTGHSFNNTGNCAEFCEMRQDVIVNGVVHSINPWRDDCEQNPVSNQPGTWVYHRNGWCPGCIVVGDVVDITEDIVAGEDNIIDFDILLANGTEYDNVSPVELLPYELVALRIYIFE